MQINGVNVTDQNLSSILAAVAEEKEVRKSYIYYCVYMCVCGGGGHACVCARVFVLVCMHLCVYIGCKKNTGNTIQTTFLSITLHYLVDTNFKKLSLDLTSTLFRVDQSLKYVTGCFGMSIDFISIIVSHFCSFCYDLSRSLLRWRGK